MTCELLEGYRMLDLTDDKGALCGKLMADVGVEVIKVEPPGGCATRKIPPFLEDKPGPDRGLYFLAYEANKSSVTINLDSADGRRLFAGLARHADFLVESFPLGYMDSIGLGYEALSKINPRLIYTSITPFGDKGPAKDYKAYDIVEWAAGGMMYLMGEEGKPPIQMSLPQAGLHAGAEAAVASLLAHYPREIEGVGQHVVVDMQACIVWTLMNEQAMPILHGDFLRRTGVYTGSLGIRRKMVYACKDGYISALVAGASAQALSKWMQEAGFAADWMKETDLSTFTPGIFMKPTEEDLRRVADLEERVGRFFITMTKQEIYENALKRRLLLAPVATVADIAADPQLKARKFFVEVEHDTIERKLTLPGAFAKLSQTPIGPPHRAPRIGEHNKEILGGVLGLSDQELRDFRATGAI
jgi:benzylsuccinate CoA-transferase BbsE subunit